MLAEDIILKAQTYFNRKSVTR